MASLAAGQRVSMTTETPLKAAPAAAGRLPRRAVRLYANVSKEKNAASKEEKREKGRRSKGLEALSLYDFETFRT